VLVGLIAPFSAQRKSAPGKRERPKGRWFKRNAEAGAFSKAEHPPPAIVFLDVPPRAGCKSFISKILGLHMNNHMYKIILLGLLIIALLSIYFQFTTFGTVHYWIFVIILVAVWILSKILLKKQHPG